MADREVRSGVTSGLALAGFAAVTMAAALYGGRNGPQRPGTARWFKSLEKPPFQPPDWVFGPAWAALYTLIAASGWRVWRQPRSRARSRALRLWIAQLGLNAEWSDLFFGHRDPTLSLAESAALLTSVASYAAAAYEVDPLAGGMVVPYVGWVAFATLLNEEIVRRNPRRVLTDRR
jgi:tryptophan-rich sensory protein